MRHASGTRRPTPLSGHTQQPRTALQPANLPRTSALCLASPFLLHSLHFSVTNLYSSHFSISFLAQICSGGHSIIRSFSQRSSFLFLLWSFKSPPCNFPLPKSLFSFPFLLKSVLFNDVFLSVAVIITVCLLQNSQPVALSLNKTRIS